MEIVTERDFFIATIDEKISNVDLEVITDLYQPLIGFKSLSVYLSLLSLGNESFEQLSHSYLFSKMQIAPGEFVQSRRTLESVGLLKTYLKKENNTKTYSYLVLKPLSAKEFFNDILFKGLLVKYIGEKKVKELLFKYLSPEIDESEYKNISASFTEVFNINLDDNFFLKDLGINKVNDENIVIELDLNKIKELLLNEYHIVKSNLPTKKELEEVKRISALYALNELAMADLLFQSYDPKEKNHYDIDKLLVLAKKEKRLGINITTNKNRKSEVFGDTNLSRKIEMMESLSPFDWLRILQNNVEPAPADLNIIDDLSKKYHLPIGVINVLIDYVLEVNNKNFPRAYTEKIAATLARNNIETAIDAMNFLSKKKSSKISKKQEKEEEVTSKEEDLSFDELLKQIDGIKN